MRSLALPFLVLIASTAAHATEMDAPIVAALEALNPDAKVARIAPSPIAGLREVIVDDQVLYLSPDGQYLVQGQILDLRAQKSLTEATRATLRQALLAEVNSADVIRFAPADPKHEVYVFTDIDCGYCRKLHQDIAAYNAAGIAVNYLAFPRSPKGSEGYAKAVQSWCASDRAVALTAAKAGEATTVCADDAGAATPVAAQHALGVRLGVSGTPAIFTADGTQIGGYLPPDAMVQRLEGLRALQKATASR
jgi:thiol:disulfide interchange protein DsbC